LGDWARAILNDPDATEALKAAAAETLKWESASSLVKLDVFPTAIVRLRSRAS
jgi:hypothetical protein